MIRPTPSTLVVPQLFTPEECERIVALGSGGRAYPGTIWSPTGPVVDLNMRKVLSSYHARTPDLEWIYERMDRAMYAAADHIGVQVAKVAEPIKVMRYDATDHFKGWHRDVGPPAAGVVHYRRVSMTVELSRRDQFEGGQLDFAPTIDPFPDTDQGDAVLFPSSMLHRVRTITNGTRHALVNWMSAAIPDTVPPHPQL